MRSQLIARTFHQRATLPGRSHRVPADLPVSPKP
jgi:hypothetical protein